MSNFEKLTAMGADVVGGDLILKHKVLGHFRNGDLHLTEEGQKMVAVDDVVVKEDAPAAPAAKPAAKAAPRRRAAAETKPVEALPQPETEPELEIDVE